MMHLKPSEIRFSQDSISNKFDQPNVFIGDTLDDLIKGKICIIDIPVISVKKVEDKWVSADNRRLWVFKHLEKLGKCETIPVKEVRYIPPFKNSSKSDGLSVKIRRGGKPGGASIPVFEKSIKDRNTELEKHGKTVKEIKMELASSNAIYFHEREKHEKTVKEIKMELASSNARFFNEREKYEKTVKEIKMELASSNARYFCEREKHEKTVKEIKMELASSNARYFYEREKHQKTVEEIQLVMASSNAIYLQLKGLLHENENEEIRSRELLMKLDESRDTVAAYQKYTIEQRAEIESLKDELKCTQANLSKSEDFILQSKDSYEQSIAKLRAKMERLEDTIKELATQLSDSDNNFIRWSEVCNEIKTYYIKKQRALEYDNERLRQSMIENAESKAKIESMANKLESVNKITRS